MSNAMYMTKLLSNGQLYTPVCRLRFPALDKPRAKMGDETKKRFSATLLFDISEADIMPLDAAARELAKKAFGPGWEKIKDFKLPLKDGAEKYRIDEESGETRYLAGYGPGIWYIDSQSLYAPKLLNRDRSVAGPEIFYDGCFVRAIGGLYAYKPSKNNPVSKSGIGFGFNALQFVRDGEQLGGAKFDESELDDID